MFVHLHFHSEYSLLDGAARIKQAVKRAGEMEMPALAITDHGAMHGVVEFYKTCNNSGIKPILGCEVYVAPRTMSDRTPKIDDNLYHLVLLAENEEGYHNLLNVVSQGFTRGFYYKPRVDKELLAVRSRGLIALSGCIAGEVAAKILAGDNEKARQAAGEYRDIFGPENYYLELQDHGFTEQRTANRELLKIHKEMDIPLVVTNDVHYVRREDAGSQDVLLAIQTGRSVDDPGRMKFQSEELYLKSPEEMKLLFGEYPQALQNTLEIAGRCNVKMEFGNYFLPHYAVPEGYNADTYLEELCFLGARKLYGDLGGDIKGRMEFELGVIKQMGYSAYFLIVWDFIHFARTNGIPVGPGRGSAAGSLVAYSLGITNIDPLKYGLLFERFLNPDRVSMPDIDIDFCFERRGEVIDYVVQKYGADHVAQIITFGTMAARAAIRDVGRALSMPYGDVDKVAKLVPAELNMTIEKALHDAPELKELYDQRAEVTKLIDTASALEGMPRHASTHAAGIVITPEPLTHYIPLYKASDGPVTTQFAMGTVEELGLLKMDMLGLRTLTVISDAIKAIAESAGDVLDIDKIPIDDKLTYEMLTRGETAGIFQLESSGMRAILKELKPEVFEDIVALVALYRPGPLGSGMVEDFVKNKHGIKKTSYLHPKLEPILKDTYGVILYQEQVMRISSELAGFSLGEADLLRRAMGKKKPEIIAGLRTQFVEGAVKNGVNEDTAGQIFDLMEFFAGYGFNKCLTGDTKIVNYEGRIKTIKEIYETNDFCTVLTLDDNLKLVKGKISAIHENGIKDVYRLRTRTGRIIKATSNHKLLSFQGWKPLKSLNTGDHIAVPRNLPLQSSKSMSKHELAILAYVLSEGNTCHPQTFYYYTNSKEELNDYLHYLSQFRNAQATVVERRDKYEVHVVNVKKGVKQFNEAKQFIVNMGLQWKKAVDKFVPEEIFELNNNDIAFFLGKLWVGDGCVDCRNTLVYYATSSETLAYQIQHLLLRLSIKSTIHLKSFKYRGSIKKGFTINVTGYDSLQRFIDLIGCSFVGKRVVDLTKLVVNHPYINDCLPATFARGSNDLIPYDVFGLLRKELEKKQGQRSLKEIARQIGISERNFWADSKKIKKGYRRETLQLVADYLQSPVLSRLSYSDILWDEIISIEHAGREMTYDLTVDGTHNFVANDIIVHNSHSAAYAMVSYQTAYLKANYALQYMAALLTSVKDNTDKVSAYIEECRRLGIEVLPPDVNESRESFTVAGSKIRFGLAAVKNVGLGAVESIIRAREQDGAFSDYADFCRRLDTKVVNRRVLESLIKCGAFDSLGYRRAQLMAAVDSGLALAQQSQRERENGQLSLLDFLDGSRDSVSITLPEVGEFPVDEMLALEKETLGLYISGHPLSQYRGVLNMLSTITTVEVPELPDNSEVVLGGLITGIKKTSTRRGETMAILTVEDLAGSIEVVVYPRPYAQSRLALRVDEVVVVKGRSRENGEETKIIGEEISTLDSQLEGELHLKIKSAASPMLDQVQIIMSSFKGNSPVFLHFEDEKKVIKAGEEFYVELSGPMTERLEELLGKARVKVKRKNSVLQPVPGKEETNKAELPGTEVAHKKKKEDRQVKKNSFFSILEL